MGMLSSLHLSLPLELLGEKHLDPVLVFMTTHPLDPSHPKPFKVKFGIRNDRTRDFIEDVQSGLDV